MDSLSAQEAAALENLDANATEFGAKVTKLLMLLGQVRCKAGQTVGIIVIIPLFLLYKDSCLIVMLVTFMFDGVVDWSSRIL